MESSNQLDDLFVFIASSADSCLKPWKHSVINSKENIFSPREENEDIDLTLKIECRDKLGIRHPENDLELEIYKSGSELNIILAKYDQKDQPILWQGNHPVWMNGSNGTRCKAPDNGMSLEALARKLRSLVIAL